MLKSTLLERTLFQPKVLLNKFHATIKNHFEFTEIDANSVKVDLPDTQSWLLDECPSCETILTKEDGLKYLKQMITCRKMEDSILKLYQKKDIRGFCHVYNGQEAVVTGICQGALRDQDVVVQGYRVHGWAINLGLTVDGVISELLQREDSSHKGRGGSMHLYNNRLFGGQGIVGSTGPIGVGLALGQVIKKNKGISIAAYGDGAANQGQIYEALNLAGLMKLPVIFLIENNLYGMGTSVERASATTSLFKRVDFCPGICVDGMNVLAVREVCRFCIDHVLEKGPIIMEARTYRYKGHSVADPGVSYRPQTEIKDVREHKDPIQFLKQCLFAFGFLTEEEYRVMDKNIKKEIEGVVENAMKKKFPDVKTLGYYQYSKPLSPVRGILTSDVFVPSV